MSPSILNKDFAIKPVKQTENNPALTALMILVYGFSLIWLLYLLTMVAH